jgi:hypothetical protein
VLTGILTAVVGKAVLGQPLSLGEAWAGPVGLLPCGCASSRWRRGALVACWVRVRRVGAGVSRPGVLLLLGSRCAAARAGRLSLLPAVAGAVRAGPRAGRHRYTSLRRSWLRVKGDWWRVFGITLLTFDVALFVTLVIQVPFELLGYGSPGDLFSGPAR